MGAIRGGWLSGGVTSTNSWGFLVKDIWVPMEIAFIRVRVTSRARAKFRDHFVHVDREVKDSCGVHSSGANTNPSPKSETIALS